MMITKESIERMTFNAGLTQEHRERTEVGELLIADGFVENRKLNTYFARFKDEEDDLEADFPWGAYVGQWWIHNDKQIFGGTCFFDPLDSNGRVLQYRVNATMEKAGEFIASLKDVKNAASH